MFSGKIKYANRISLEKTPTFLNPLGYNEKQLKKEMHKAREYKLLCAGCNL